MLRTSAAEKIEHTASTANVQVANLGPIEVVDNNNGSPFQDFPLHKVYYPPMLVDAILGVIDSYRRQLRIVSPEYEREGIVTSRRCRLSLIGLAPDFMDLIKSLSQTKVEEEVLKKAFKFEDPVVFTGNGAVTPIKSFGRLFIHGLAVYRRSHFDMNKEFILNRQKSGSVACPPLVACKKDGLVYSYVDTIYLSGEYYQSFTGWRVFTPRLETKNFGVYGAKVSAEIKIDPE